MRKRKNTIFYVALAVLSVIVVVLSIILIVIFSNGWINVPKDVDPREQISTITDAQNKKKQEPIQDNETLKLEPRLETEEKPKEIFPLQPDSEYNLRKDELLESQPTIVE